MKTRYLAYFLFLLLPVACKDGLEPSDSAIPDHCIELTISNLAPVMQTKADTEAGDDALHENTVHTVDCFFFPAGANENTPAVFQVKGRSAEAITGGYRVRVAFPNSVGESMFGSIADGNTCKVYVICNASLDYGASPTMAQLKAKVLTTDFAVQGVQNSFVMSAVEAGTVTLHVDAEDIVTATGSVDVRRSAARIQLYFRIATETTDELNQKWERPAGAPMYIRMANAAKRGAVDGNYTLQDADYFTTAERLLTELPEENRITGKTDYIYSHIPFYTYPLDFSGSGAKVPEIRIRIPWRIKAGGQNVEYRTYRLSPTLDDTQIEGNHYYRILVNINTLGAREEEDPVWVNECSYSVMNWINFSISAGGQGDIPADLHTYQYLVVDEPEQTIDNETTARYYYISSSPLVETGVSRSKITKVQYIRRTAAGTDMETYTATSDDAISALGITTSWNEWDDDGNSYLKIEHSLSDMYVAWDIEAVIQNADGKTETIKLTQRPPIYIDTKDGGNAFVDGYFRLVAPAPFANAYAHTAAGWTGYYRSASYYRGANYTTPAAGYGFVGTRNRMEQNRDLQNGESSYMVYTPYGNMYSTPTGANLTMNKLTAVHLSSFHENNDSYSVNVVEGASTTATNPKYRIGDPRVDNDFTGTPKLVDYLTGMGAYTTPYTEVRRYAITTAAWGEMANQIKIGQTDHSKNNIIAPYYLVNSAHASQYGADGFGLSFEEAKKKCATYQEGGYPAGRWRLPTEAEIMFIISRQADETIPVLFNTTDASACYWAASGYYYNQGKIIKNTTNYSDGACRCVYDAWYWGDTPPLGDNSYKFTPML